MRAPENIRTAFLGMVLVAGCTPGTDRCCGESPSRGSASGSDDAACECDDPGTDSPTPGVFPDICDGSDEIRLSYADWRQGAADTAVDYVMYAEGTYFLRVDGHCRYYVFDGDASSRQWWEPIREGVFDEEELLDVLTRLQVDRWHTLDEEDLSRPNAYHAEWQRFEAAGEVYDCPRGCALQGLANEIVGEALHLIEELAQQTEEVYAPSTIELTVVPWVAASTLPVMMTWGADIPMEDVLDDPVEANLSGDPEDIGTFLQAAEPEAQWFLDARQQYLDEHPVGSPSAIGILEDGAVEAQHLLYIRPVAPW